MSHRIQGLVRGLALVLGLLSVTVSHGASWEIGRGHRDAIKQMIEEMGTYDIITASIKSKLAKMGEENPEKADRIRKIFRQVNPEQLDEILIPVFAYYYDKKEARSIAKFLRTRPGRMVIENAKNKVAGKEKKKTVLTDDEEIMVRKFFNSDSGRAFRQSMPFIKRELKYSGGILGTRLVYEFKYPK